MTIVLISMTIIPIIDATFTSIKASAPFSEVAEVETVLLNAADRVNRAPTLCDYTSTSRRQRWPRDGMPTQVDGHEPVLRARASATAADAGTWANGAMPPACRTDTTPRLIQMVTITVTSESGKISEASRW